MSEAYNYNAHLLKLIRRFRTGSGSILDFGAGAGTFSVPLRAESTDVVCVEVDPELRRELEGHTGLVACQGLEEVVDESIEYAFTVNVLEHIEDDINALRELREKLSAGGGLFVYVPAFQVLYTSMDTHVGHFRRYTKGSLKYVLEQAGFTVQRVCYVDSLGFLATLVYKVLSNRDGRINRRSIAIYDRAVFPISLILDRLCSGWLGKNVMAFAVKGSN